MDIAVIGSNMVDLISYITRMPEEGETIEAPDFRMGCGGKGANQAVTASRLGAKVVMVTRVGSDIFAENTIRNFEENGIDSQNIIRTEGSSGVAPIFVDQDSHNSIIIVKGANRMLSPKDIENAAPRISSCKLIVLQLEIPLETVYAAVQFGKENNIPVLLNPAPAHPALVLEKIKDAHFIVPNETELSLLTGMPVDTLDDIANAAHVLLDAGIPNVIVTLGSRGVYWISKDEERFFEPTIVDARDTTGAGDAFIGCFSRYWVATGDIAHSIEVASTYAADSVTRLGTQSSYATSDEFLSRFPQIKAV